MARKYENAAFVCMVCNEPVAPVTNGSVRNHCPFCLWSRHMDEVRPGDRRSGCCAPMRPMRLIRKKKGFQIVHRCTRCGKEHPNRIALDTVQDDLTAVLAFMRAGACAPGGGRRER